MHTNAMRKRRECLDCRSHTLVDECVNCGSTRLQPVMPTPGDIRNAAAPPGPGALKWQRTMLETPAHRERRVLAS